MKQLTEIDAKIFEFAEKNAWLWQSQKAWDAYEKQADDDEGFYPFFEKHYRQLKK